MSLEFKILKTKNRIALLSERNKDNGRIVAKLQRELRTLRTKLAAADSEVQ